MTDILKSDTTSSATFDVLDETTLNTMNVVLLFHCYEKSTLKKKILSVMYFLFTDSANGTKQQQRVP